MLPEEIYASVGHSSKFKYSHPLSHVPVDDGSLRARLAYDLMSFMQRQDCNYFVSPENVENFNPTESDDEVDIMIVDGFYKEAEIVVEQRLAENPDCEKTLFQKAFIQHLKMEYEKLLDRENNVLQMDPYNTNALLNKGFALANLNREEEALAISDLALSIDPENLNVLTNKAYIAKLLGRDELQRRTLVRAYNVSSKKRLEALEAEEARLLVDFGANFEGDVVSLDTPSAFEEFNKRSGMSSSEMMH